jgi:ADP-ribose pyrophosphatase YjhB (NUDIX family)
LDIVEIPVSREFLDSIRESVERKRSSREIVLVVPRPAGNVLLHTKAFYPPDGFRLPTGRLKDGEQPEAAFAREFREELGQDGRIERDLGVFVQRLTAADRESIDFTSYIYLTNELTADPKPEDESEQISGFRDVPISELRAVAERLRNLGDGWEDWGRWRAPAHEFVAERLA